MKIALLGSAPSSLGLAPFGHPEWKIWGCSPGVYYQCGNPQAWFELHRWEPPQIGNPSNQKQWFSPEYVAWMSMRNPAQCPVWMKEPVPEIPASRALPVEDLLRKYGTYFFTSSLAWMIACAIEDILEERATRKFDQEDEIAMYGVDMAATEEYGYQRAGCQHFLLIAADLGIRITVPPESDLMRPMPLYGIDESEHWMIKFTSRRQEHEQRIAAATNMIESAKHSKAFMEGALDELRYQMQTWGGDRTGMGMDPRLMAQMPRVRDAALLQQPKEPPHTEPVRDVSPPHRIEKPAKQKASRKR